MVIRQKNSKKNPLLCGWMDGWMDGRMDGRTGIKSFLRFSSNSSMLRSRMCWFQIWCKKLCTVFLSELMNIFNFKIGNFKTSYPVGKWLKKFNYRKDVWSPPKVRKVFQKNSIWEDAISSPKLWKILLFQKWLQKATRTF